MAFQMPARNNVAQMTTRAQNDNWKADAFVNVYLPRKDGSRAKLGSLNLKLSRTNDAQVIEYLANAPDLEAALEQLKNRLVIDFHRADGTDSAELDLG